MDEQRLEKESSKEQEPVWKRDNFLDEEHYERHMVRLVEDLLDESTRAFKSTKEGWCQGDKRLKVSDGLEIVTSGNSTTRTDLPIVPQAIEEAIATAVESLPRPTVTPRQAAQDDFCGALNYFMSEELDANDFDLLMARVVFDMKRFGIGFIKQSVDRYSTGPFGQNGKIVLSKVDPRYVWPDPLASRFEDCRYFIEARPMDLSDIQELYPIKGLKVQAESAYGMKNTGDTIEDVTIAEANSDEGNYITGDRRRAMVKELWLKDDTKALKEIYDENGQVQLDSEGKPKTRYEKRYPHGRLIVTANKVLLLDIPNPFRHGQRPYTPFPGRISGGLFTYGDVEILGKIEDKINLIQKDMMRNARVNMNSPWIIDQHAFDSPKKFQNITQDPGLVLPVRPGARVMRLPPAELPQFIFPLIDWLKQQFDDVLGVQSISRGQVEKGSQLSAEAIQNLQGTANSRTRLKSRLLENALKNLGQLLQWNIRQFYPSKIQAQLNDPANPGQQRVITWSDQAAQGDYAVAIQAGSSLPGAKQSMTQLALTLWDHGLIGPRKALGMMEFPGVEAAVMERQQMLDKLAAVNLNEAVKEATGQSNKTGKAGRKFGAVQM